MAEVNARHTRYCSNYCLVDYSPEEVKSTGFEVPTHLYKSPIFVKVEGQCIECIVQMAIICLETRMDSPEAFYRGCALDMLLQGFLQQMYYRLKDKTKSGNTVLDLTKFVRKEVLSSAKHGAYLPLGILAIKIQSNCFTGCVHFEVTHVPSIIDFNPLLPLEDEYTAPDMSTDDFFV